MNHVSSHDIHDLNLEDTLRYAVAIGAVLILLLPGARGFSETLGWLPLWLLAMPLTAWWALRRLRRSPPAARTPRVPARMRRPGVQVRRRPRPLARPAVPHAA